MANPRPAPPNKKPLQAMTDKQVSHALNTEPLPPTADPTSPCHTKADSIRLAAMDGSQGGGTHLRYAHLFLVYAQWGWPQAQKQHDFKKIDSIPPLPCDI